MTILAFILGLLASTTSWTGKEPLNIINATVTFFASALIIFEIWMWIKR